MNNFFTISALLGLTALAAGGGLLAGFSGGSSEARTSSPTAPVAASHSPSPEVTLTAVCTGAVPSALRVARFEKAPVSSDATIGSIPESPVANSSREISEVAETESLSSSSPNPIAASRKSGRLPTLSSNVNPTALGNSFAHNGQRVSVADVSHSADGEVSGIDLQSSPESAAAAQNQQQASAKKPGAKGSSKSPYKWGFTYEEELFRTKWGWDAFAQAQSLGNHQ